MSRILRVDMGRLRVKAEETGEGYRLLGGHALTSHIVRQEVPPLCDPLNADNRLVFAPGLLGGTAVTTAGRTSVGAKSPLTGGVKEANVGGLLGHKLARLGIKALIMCSGSIVRGQPSLPPLSWRGWATTRRCGGCSRGQAGGRLPLCPSGRRARCGWRERR